MSKRVVSIIAFIIVVGSAFYMGTLFGSEPTIDPTEFDINDTFQEVMDELLDDHVSQPDAEELWQGAIDGMIESLDDPYTTYFDYEEAASYTAGFGESYVGIGVTVTFIDEVILVEAVKDDGPADNAGILPNDIITHVDGVDVRGANYYETIGNILGDEGTEVTIGLSRPGVDTTIYLTMTRDVIPNSTITYTTFTSGTDTVGYIEVTKFGDATSDLFSDAVADLEATGIDGLIVDLRNNGGGHLYTVLNMLNEFLVDNGKEMFSTEYYVDGEFFRQEYDATNSELKDYEIVTLVNGNSASASEVFASAMQEQGGYTVLGETTYGKGTMQTDARMTTTEGDSVHITIGKWLTANGNWVHYDGGTDGVTPDVEVIPTDMERAYKLFIFEETLDYDTVDSRIANMQHILNIMGYDVRTDGYFDSETLDAIHTIQTNNSIVVSDNVGQEVFDVLNAALDEYQDDLDNDSQLAAAIQYIIDNQ